MISDCYDRDIFARAESSATKCFSLSPRPPVFRSAQGIRLTSTQGRHYLDFASGSGTSGLGHNHPRIVAALHRQLKSGIIHIGPHFHSASQAALYQALLDVMPEGLTRLHPATNGTEASEVALKAAMHHTGARRFLAFVGGYHGRTFGALSVSHAKGANAGLGPFRPEAEFLPYPTSEREVEEATAALAQALTTAGEDNGPFAGIIVEPVQATAGILAPPLRFLRSLARQAAAAKVPLILDEIFTGFGRTGALFACERAGIRPDLMLLGKSLGGGLPGGLVAGREEILTAWPQGAQSSTFQLHPMTAAAGAAALETLVRDALCDRARLIGQWLELQRERLTKTSLVKRMRGLGAMYGLELQAAGPASAGKICRAARLAALERGLITWECGRHGEVIGLIPPLIATKADVEEASAVLSEALQEVENLLPSPS